MSIKRISIFFFLCIAFVALASIPTTQTFKLQYQGQTLFSGQNVNMVSGTTLPDGDPWLQRQNEPSIAVSTRNPLHLLAGANDYRTVDIPGEEGDQLPGKYENSTAGDAWLGVFKSFDGGQSWITTLLPGYPQDIGSPSPIHGYQAAADPVVRAGANGLFYYSGIAFNRGDNETGAVFIARFIDNNNDDETDTTQYLDTTIIDMENGDRFKDKPWIAVDAPRKNAGTISIDGQSIPRHNVYIVYTIFTTTENTLESKILFRRSTDCGQSWEDPIEINGSHILNQGATIAVDPRLNGHIIVAWRRFSAQNQGNAIIAAKSVNEGVGFSNLNVAAEIPDPFDQGTSQTTFRTNSYPTLAIDNKGTEYLAWAQQGVDSAHPTDSRIVISTSKDAVSWTAPVPVEFPTPDNNTPFSRDYGHQFKPSLTFGSGKLMMVWYDTRNDYCPVQSPTIDDHPNNGTRHTIDVRVAQADPGEHPVFDPSIQVSRYLWALSDDYNSIVQVQFNPPNYPLFKGGTVPFHGDYIDIALSPSFIRDKQGNWIFNTEPIQMPKFHIAWVDNRDVRPPEFNDWTNYTPPSADCANVNLEGMGMRNQNVYTSRITTALEVGTPRNSKKLGTLGYDPVTGELIPRTFVIYVKNTSEEIKSFRLKITEGPQYGEASFLQNESLDELDVEVAPYSSISRPVFVTSTNATDTVTIEVFEIDTPGGSAVSGGLASSLILNPDPSNPGDGLTQETRNPNIINPNIINWDVLNPNIINPNIINPNIINPNIINPNIINPNIINPNIINPNIINPNIINPNIINPNIINPNIINPNIINEPLEDASITDVQWRVENLGNTSSSYTFKIFAKNSLPAGIYAQLLIYKVHYTPGADPNAANPCELKNVQSHELITNIINPNIINPNIINPNIINPNIINSSIENATFYLRPGEEAVAVLRLVEPQPSEVKTLESGGIFKLQSWTDTIGAASTAQAPDSGEEDPEVSSTELMVLTSELDPATVGSYYIDNLLATGGDGTYTWSMNPNYLPPGLIYKTNGTISGTPTKDPNKTYPWIYSFLVQVASAGETNTQTVSITVNAAEDPTPPLNIQTTALGAGTIGSYYGATLKAVGGKPPYSWSKFSGTLPIGLTLDNGGNISGTILNDPNVTSWPHVYNFTVKVTDSMGGSDTQALMITVNAIPPTYWKISGYIRDDTQPPNPISGVILYGLPGAPTTDFYGYYETSVREGDSFTAEPFKSGCTFNPANRSYTEVAQDWANEDYTGSALMHTISGFVTVDGVPLPGVVLSGLPDTPETDIDGYYQGTIPHEWTGTVNPTLEGFSFTPSSITYEAVVAPLADQNYTAEYTGGDVDDVYEDNDNLTNAYPVQPGLWTNLRSMDEDWFVVNILQSGDDLSVHLTGIFDIDIDLALYDGLGNMIMEATGGQEYKHVYAANLAAGAYYIRIPSNSQSVLPYSLSIEVGELNLGTISGRVTNEESLGLHVRVNIYNDFAGWNTFSDSNGNYSIGLPPGVYRALFDPEYEGIPYLWKFYNNKLNGPAADWITVSGGVTTAGIDAQLEAEGAISGAVTDPDGQPVTEARVWAWSSSGNAYRSARTDAEGNYRIGYLRTQNYRVSVRPDLEHLAVGWYNDHYSFDSADPVHVDAGSETFGIDIQLDEGGYISGRVTDSTGIGIKNISVRAHDISGIHLISCSTDEQGNYTIPSVPATDVKVYFNPGGLDYIPEWYNNKSFFEEEVDLVSVQAGQTTTGINTQLAGAGNISGTVTDTQGNPLESIEVHVWDLAGNLWRSSSTDRYGKYTVNKLPAAPVKVRFRSPFGDYATEWYDNQTSFASAGTFTIAANHTTTGIDAQLAENGGHITGTITNSGGQGIEGVLVLAQDSSIEAAAAYTFTDASGNFNIPRLPTSQYKVYFNAGYNWLNHTSEYYDNQPDYAQATLVSVTAGQIRSGINAVLDERPPLNILTTSLPDGVAGETYNTVLEAAGGQPMYSWALMPGELLPQGLSIDANGIISGIPVVQGDFTIDVQVIDSASLPQIDIQSIDIHIIQYGGVDKEISGRITSNGVPVQGVVISGFPNPPTSDAYGFYTALVPLGWEGNVTPALNEFDFNPASRTYTSIADNISGQNYEATYTGGDTEDIFDIDPYNNDDFANAAPINVGTTSNLKLLDDDWYVVNVPSGEDLKVTAEGILGNDIDVAVYDSAGNQIIETTTGPQFDTVYVDGGSGGDFKIHIRYFWDEGLQNVYSLTVETAPSFGTGIISGTVTDEGLIPIRTDVWVYHDTEGWLWRSISNTNGVYRISVPPDNLYKIQFRTFPQYNYEGVNFVPEWYNDAISSTEAATLTVLTGQTVANIDGKLAPAGSISGHIDDGYGNPGWAQINVYDYKQAFVASGTPDGNGDYTIERIPPGNYKLRFRPDWNHAVQWSGNQNSYEEAHPIPVQAGQTTNGIDIQLGEAGYLHGRVTDTSGNPIQGIWVYAYDESTFYTGMNALCSNQTDENGEYWLGRLPTTNIKLYFYTWEAEESYVTEIYDNKPGIDLGDPIAVIAGETTDLEAVELETGGIFTGRVTDSQGEGLRGILVWPFHLDNYVVYYNYDQTDADGYYTVKGVPAEVKIRFRPPYYGDTAVQWYNGKASYLTADILPVPPGETVTDIDAQMPGNGGKITGRVTNSSGTGIGGVHIHVYDTELEAHYTSAFTDANGFYTVRRLPTCKLKLHFDTDYRNLNYLSEYYKDKTTFAGATQVQANLGKMTANINVVLSPRPGLAVSTTTLPTGSVSQEYGATVQASGGREYYHFSLYSGSLPNGLILHSNGDISGVPTQSGTFNFTVEVIDSSIDQQSVTQNLSITIDPYAGTGFLISGTVIENGSPLPMVEMNGLPGNPLTNAAGQYSVVVYPGWNGMVTPTLEGYAFDPPSRTYNHVDQNYELQDYIAQVGYTIRGTVLIDGLPLTGVLMNGLPGEVRTDENGNYSGMVISGWTGTVAPALPGFTFDPVYASYSNVSSDQLGEDYSASYTGGQDDAYEDNDDWTSASEITLGTHTGLVLLDIDWFKFNISPADAGKDLKIHFQGTSYPDPNIRRDLDFIVLDGSGKLLGCVISGTDDETLYLTDVAEGTYYVGQEYIGLTGTVYSMSLEVSDNFGIGYISGRVTDETSGQGVEGIYVELYAEYFDWNVSRPFITTDADGYFKVGYSPGNYTVRFNLTNMYHREPLFPDINYIGKTYNNNEIVEAVAGTTVTGIDVVLAAGGTITGRITDPDGNGTYNALVSVCSPGVPLISSGFAAVSYGYTNEEGYYTADRMRTGNYKVRFRPTNWSQDIRFGTQWYNDTGTFADGEPVPVQAGTTTSEIDAQLRETAYIEGHVTNSQGDPIRDIQVTAYDVSGYGIVSAWTDDDGYYYLGNRLPEGDVILYFNANNAQGNYVSEYHTDKLLLQEADPITLQSGQTVLNIDAQLADGGSITGRVTDDYGSGIYNLAVICSDINSENFYSLNTDGNGDYTIRHIAPGYYKVRFRQAVNYAVEWYNNRNSYSEGEILSVGAGQTVEGIDAELSQNAGFITGYVRDEFGNGIGDVIVRVFDSSLLGHISSVITKADGYYSAPGLPTCDAKINFDTDSNSLNYLMEFYNDKGTFEDADLIAAELGQETSNINAVLSPIPDLNITTASLPNGEVAFPYSTTLDVTGGREFYHWSLISGSLPDGLMMNGGGEILGTPTAQGTYSFTVQVTDSSRSQMSDTQNLSLTIDAYGGTDCLISGTVTFEGSPLTGVIMQGLPGNPVTNNGQYIAAMPPGWSGTARPTLAGYYFDPPQRIYSSVNSTQSNQDYTAYEQTLNIVTEYLTNGMQGLVYNQSLVADGGTEPYSWTLVSGSLPYGLTLNSNGIISGIPTQSNWYDFTVRATDSGSPSQIGEKQYSMYVIWEDLISEAPVLYWKLNDTSENTAKDSSGRNIRGILFDNAAFTADSFEGNAVGTSGRGWIQAETWRGEFCFANEATVLAYVKIDDLNLNRTVWTLRQDRPGVGWPYTLDITLKIKQNLLSLESVNGLNVGYENCPHFNLDVDLSTNPGGFSTGVYHQIAVSIKDNVYKIFINGVEVNSGAGAPFEVYDYMNNFLLMGSDWADSYLNGQADEVMVFNKALESPEVLDVYTSGPQPTISGHISFSDGNSLSWVWMRGFPGNAYTDENGNYTVAVPDGWSGTITPNHWSSYFQPTSRSYTNVTADLTAEDYTAYEQRDLWITTNWLPDGTKGQSYNVSLQASDGVEPYSWNLASGTLPNGLTLDSSGTLSGTPTEAGDFSFTVSVTDSASPQQGATQTLNLHISAEHQGFWTTTYPFGGHIHAKGLAIDVADPDVVFAAAQSRGIFKTENAGSSWSNLIEDPEWPYGETDYHIFIIHQGSGNFYTCTGGRIYKSTDRGLNWSQIYEREDWDINSIEITPSDPDIIYAGTWRGEMFKTIDGGTNWVACGSGLPAETSIDVITVDPNSATTVYAGMNNGVYKSTDSGDNWISINNNIDFGWIEDIAVKPGDSNIVYVSGWSHSYGDGIFQSTDGGQNWTQLRQIGIGWNAGRSIAIDTSDTSIIYLASWQSVFKSTNGGSNWTEYSLSSSSSMTETLVIHPTNSQILYAGTHGDGVFKSTDGGLTWTAVNNGIRALASSGEVHSLEIDEYNPNYIYSGSIGGGYRSLDVGASWEKMDFPQGSMTAIVTHPGSPGTVYAGHNSFWKRTYNINTGAWIDSSWVDPTVPPFCCVSRIDIGIAAGGSPDVIYFGAKHSEDPQPGMYRSEDGGVTWTLKNNGLTHTDIRTIAVPPADSQTVFAGTEWEWPLDPGKDYGLYKTTDGGDNWVYISSGLPGAMYIHQIIYFPSDPNIMYLNGGGDGFCGVFKSIDGGENWEQVSNDCVFTIAVSPNNPDLLYMGDWNGFYVSLNGGSSRIEFNDGLPRNPDICDIHLDPNDPLHVFIATGAGVYEATFSFDLDILTESLPNGFVGESYTASLEASGGTAPYTWEILSGELPDDLAMASNGSVSGTPLIAGYYEFTVKVTDSNETPLSYQKNVNINILNKYTLDVAANPFEGGTVTKDPDQEDYIEGDYVDVSVTVNPGYFFTGWSGDATGTASLVHVQMIRDKNLTANFALTAAVPDYHISAFSAPDTANVGDIIGSSVTATVGNQGGSDTYPDEISVGIYISPDATITPNDILLWKGRSNISALTAGGTIGVIIDPDLQIPTTVTAGSYSIGALVDEFNVIAETNETNNSASETITITSAGYDFTEILGGWGYGCINGYDINATGDLAVIGNGGTVQILDVSDPSEPTLMSELSQSPTNVTHIKIIGDLAYIAYGAAGLVILDISDPSNPRVIGICDTIQWARSLDISGNYAYVTDYNQGLRIIDISDPASPSEIAFLPHTGRTRLIKVSGNFAYITLGAPMGETGIGGVRIVDVSDPYNPQNRALMEIGAQEMDVDGTGQFLFIPQSGNYIRIYDVSNPDAPLEVSSYEGIRYPNAVKIYGNLAYVSDDREDRIVVLDISDIYNISELSSYWFDYPTSVIHPRVSDDLCFVNSWQDSLRIVDFSDFGFPQEVGHYDVAGMLFYSDVSNDHAYVVNARPGPDRIKILDISDPSSVTEASTFNTPYDNLNVLRTSGDFAYLATSYDGLRVINISNPSSPVEVGAVEDIQTNDIVISGRNVYVASGWDGLSVVDISTPSNPVLISSLYVDGPVSQIAVAGEYAYLALGWRGLRIVDISDPKNPCEVGAYESDGSVSNVSASSGIAYIYDDYTMYIIDVSDPSNPVELSTFDINMTWGDIGISGNYIFVPDWIWGVRVIDVSDPSSPVEVELLCSLFLGEDIVVHDNRIYVIDRDSGFYILELRNQ